MGIPIVNKPHVIPKCFAKNLNAISSIGALFLILSLENASYGASPRGAGYLFGSPVVKEVRSIFLLFKFKFKRWFKLVYLTLYHLTFVYTIVGLY